MSNSVAVVTGASQGIGHATAIRLAAYGFATGERLASSDFEGGKTGAVKVLGQLGFTVQARQRPAR